jgi:hypothetical protein
MIKKDIRPLLIILLLSALWISCDSVRDPCLQPTTVPLRIIAKKAISDTTSVDTLLPHPYWFTVDSLDTIKYGIKVSRFSLQLSPVSDSCRFALQPDSAVALRDTISFYYVRRLQFISNECGFTHFYTLQSIKTTNHLIDSIRINNADVNQTASSPDHVQIFF